MTLAEKLWSYVLSKESEIKLTKNRSLLANEVFAHHMERS